MTHRVPQGVAVRSQQRGAGVEADAGIVQDQRIVGKAGVDEGIGDHQNLVRLQDRVGTEGQVARGLRRRQPQTRLEPLPFLVNQRDERNGRAADLRGQERDVVIALLRGRIQDLQPAQGGKARGFIGGQWGLHARERSTGPPQ